MKGRWGETAARIFALVAIVAGSAYGADRSRIELFSPQGPVKNIRQVTVRFSTPMVALGDPRLPDPFAVECPAAGKGRWADTRNWVYDFDADLPAGLNCRFKPVKNLRALDGGKIAADESYGFNTGGPAIIASFPHEGRQDTDEDQAFLLKLDAPATTASIEANAHCVIDGITEQVPVQVLAGEARTAMLKARAALGYDYFRLLWKSGAETSARVRDRTLETAEASIVALKCGRRLPPATAMQLRWGKGVATESGIATSEDQNLAFRVRAAFTAQVSCTRTNMRGGCIPMLPITVGFSVPVPRAKAIAIRLKTADGHLLTPVADAVAQVATVTEINFKGPFPSRAALQVILPDGFVDDAGRTLENAARFPLEMQVDDYPPLARFSGQFGILEASEGGILPVTVRNLETALPVQQSAIPGKTLRLGNDPAALADWIRRVEHAEERSGKWVKRSPEDIARHAQDDDAERDVVWQDETGKESVFGAHDTTTTFTLPTMGPKKPTEVVGIPLKEPGFYVVELQSKLLGEALLGKDQTRYVSTAALVTNLAVHFKWGREASRVWVTRLDTGVPVAEAEVTIASFCNGSSRWHGRTDADGVAVVEQSLGEPHGNSRCGKYWPDPLLVTASKDEDFSFMQSGWNQGIQPMEFGLHTGSVYHLEIDHTVLDRPLFRAGETVSMKHYLRRHSMRGMDISGPLTRNLSILHRGSGQKFDLEAKFDAQGVAETQWQIPAEAKLGTYEISLDDDNGRPRETAQFRVEQFRLPSMHASISGSAQPLINPQSANLDLHVAYLSGGGASGLAVKVRTLVEPQEVTFADYKDYQFGGAPVREGVTTNAGGFNDYDFESGTEDSASKAKAQVMPATLDGSGSARVTIPNLPKLDGPALLNAELEYADANGEILTATGRVRLAPSTLTVGIRREGWAASAEQMRFRVLVLDLDGKPKAQQLVTVTLYQAKNYSYRKRLIGGFYTYETTRETRKLALKCNGTTDAQGLLPCEVSPGASGEVLVRAETKDAQGHISGATSSIWVAGQDDWWFGGSTGDRMDLLPEKREYEAGETARFQVRMPFRKATALVTVEREGVMKSFVTTLDGRTPTIDVPIDGGYAPNVFVSVLAVRGRVAHAERSPKGGAANEITALVDLNKPAYRLGLAEIKVGWKPHRLDVHVAPERKTYRVRDKAQVHIHVSRADGGALAPGSEIAIAAVDEALLELASNSSWALLDAMMGERGLEVLTSTAQMQVVGKRHYGRKAVPHGGGGGREGARERFDSLLLWKGRVAFDAHGDATVSVPLNDSLSSFRIVAIAHSGKQHFGTGSAEIATAQDLILVSGLPPLVREGDHYAATFTVRNTSTRSIAADISPSVTPATKTPLAPQHIEIPAGEARDLVWQVDVPVGSPTLQWDVNARENGGAATDRVKISESVIPAFPVRTYQATIAQLDAPLTFPAQQPAGSVPGRGGLEITLRDKLGNGLDGVREFMRGYPYICLEQNLSRAVALRDRDLWDDWMRRLPGYRDHDGLLKYFQSERLQGDDALTAYVLAIADEAGWPIPGDERKHLTDALAGFVHGKIVRESALPTADLAIRKLAAIEALSRYKAADAAMLDSIAIEPNLWPTSALIDWLGILTRVEGIPQAQEKRAAALIALRARLNFQGTIMTFSTERTDALWWLMISSDSNANRMLLSVLGLPEWRDDIPRLVRGALGRQQAGHWNTTVANAWGVLAMEKFSAAFESMPVVGDTRVQYAGTTKTITLQKTDGTAEVDLPWQKGRADLAITHEGGGKPWVIVRATAALPLDKPLSTGFKITRTVEPVEQQAHD